MSALPSTRELRALDIVEVVPAGCFALLVTGEAWAPHLQPGELAIVDTADTAPQRGELYALAFTARSARQTDWHRLSPLAARRLNLNDHRWQRIHFGE